MRREEALSILRLHHADIRQFGVNSISLCGSVARDEARPDSDVDVLVEFENGAPRFDQYMDLKFFLEDLLLRPVDLLTLGGLRPAARPSILHDAIHVA